MNHLPEFDTCLNPLFAIFINLLVVGGVALHCSWLPERQRQQKPPPTCACLLIGKHQSFPVSTQRPPWPLMTSLMLSLYAKVAANSSCDRSCQQGGRGQEGRDCRGGGNLDAVAVCKGGCELLLRQELCVCVTGRVGRDGRAGQFDPLSVCKGSCELLLRQELCV